ncbi:hypothetical protein ACIQXZ_32470 [Bacillus thuringiensis]|uniref:hypothetical protein n=1 Tax=Bacillus thuringiensis TaxID=1428 RepID=UPI00381EE119
MVSTICAFTPNRQEIYRYDGSPGAWSRIKQAGGVGELYGGGFGLFATMYNIPDYQPGHLFWWRRRMYNYVFNSWHPIGLPGAMFAVTSESVYGLTPNRGAVFRYNGSGTSWTMVGGAADAIYAFEEQD